MKKTNATRINRTLAALGAATLLLAGCAAPPLPKDASMVHRDQTVVIVERIPPKPDLYRIGAQGLLDIAINHAVTSTVADHIQSMPVPSLDPTRDQIAQALKSKGYKVSIETKPIDLKTLPKNDGTQRWRTNGDWSAFAHEHHADYVLLLSLLTYGAQRSYYGFFPLTKPSPACNFLAELIDPRTNMEVWNARATSAPDQVDGWDDPPDYARLTDAIQNSYATTQRDIVANVSRGFPGLVTAATGSLAVRTSATPAASASGVAASTTHADASLQAAAK